MGKLFRYHSLATVIVEHVSAHSTMRNYAIVLDMDSSQSENELRKEKESVELESLLEAIVQQDESAFASFYDATVGKSYGLALRITQRHEFAEEVVCDVYLQVWRQAGRFDPRRGDVMAWLMVLCRSRALDLLRRESHLMPSDIMIENLSADQTLHPQDLHAAREQNKVLFEALESLDEQQRQLLALAFFRGYSHSELANITGLPLGTVKTRLRRAMAMLKDRLSRNSIAGERI